MDDRSSSNVQSPLSTVYIFDYDHTIVNENSDTYIPELLGARNAVELINKHAREVQWTELMDMVLVACQTKDAKTIEEISETAKLVPCFPELVTVLQLAAKNGQVHIASDANTLYIESFVKHKELTVKEIHTNPVRIEDGLLRLDRYAKEGHACKRCPINMCKGSIVRDRIIESYYLKSGLSRPRIVYFGDGSNDYCPVLSVLEAGDLVFARDDVDDRRARGLVRKIDENPSLVKAKVFRWAKGKDLLELFLRHAL